jgi:hypothetical protein
MVFFWPFWAEGVIYMGGLEHVHLAGARSQLPSRWSVYCNFLDVWYCSTATTYPIYKFDSSIDSALVKGYSAPVCLLAGTNFLCVVTPNMWRRKHLVCYP